VITNLLVERVEDELRVRWRGGDDPTVFFSGSPDDAGTVIVPVETPGRLRVAGLPAGYPIYVHVLDLDGRFVVAADRIIPVGGTRNLRDLGGYRGHDGRAVRWGRLYRSDSLDEVTVQGAEVFGRLGIRTVCDLRGEAAPSGRPSGLDVNVTWSRAAMGNGDAHHDGLVQRIASGEIKGITDDDMAGAYRSMLVRYAPEIGTVITRAADRAQQPLLFHCAAGKDRTGVVAALLLGALGVADGDILDDYELTNRYRGMWRVDEQRSVLASQGVNIDHMLAYYLAPRRVMAATLRAITESYGSIPSYLTDVVGLSPATLDALRDGLLDPES